MKLKAYRSHKFTQLCMWAQLQANGSIGNHFSLALRLKSYIWLRSRCKAEATGSFRDLTKNSVGSNHFGKLCFLIFIFFYKKGEKQSQQILIKWLKNKKQLQQKIQKKTKNKNKNAKSTQRYPGRKKRQQCKMKQNMHWVCYKEQLKSKLEKITQKNGKYPSQNVPRYHNHFVSPFLQY